MSATLLGSSLALDKRSGRLYFTEHGSDRDQAIRMCLFHSSMLY
jgi:hypothetical protein